MPTPMTSGSFGDLLDPRFQKIFVDTLKPLPDMLGEVYTMVPSNGRNNMTWSEVGTLTDWDEFTGTVAYSSLSQGYDVTLTPLEFTKGTQVNRKLFDDDQYHVMDQKPKSVAESYYRTRQKHGAHFQQRLFGGHAVLQPFREGVALCSNSHTTTSGASTASGFDNLTTALTATAVFAMRLQMVGYRGDQAERNEVMPDELWYPPDLSEQAFEIVNPRARWTRRTTTATSTRAATRPTVALSHGHEQLVHVRFQYAEAIPVLVRPHPGGYAMVEDFDTLVAKWRR